MSNKKTNTFIKIITIVSFLIMIIVNALANIIPINGVTTGEVSNSYENLFAPAGYTFAIWGLIYILLAGYTLYQFGFFQTNRITDMSSLFNKIGLFFFISSISNVLWIFSWHYYYIGLSLLFMIVILLCLIIIVEEINKNEFSLKFSFKDMFFIRLPFSVYFGWITIATIANVTTFLVSIGWDGFGISEVAWTIIIITVGLLISIVTILKNKDIAYGLVIIWAYVGILVKHISPSGFDGQYTSIITTVIISIVILIIVELYTLKLKAKNYF